MMCIEQHGCMKCWQTIQLTKWYFSMNQAKMSYLVPPIWSCSNRGDTAGKYGSWPGHTVQHPSSSYFGWLHCYPSGWGLCGWWRILLHDVVGLHMFSCQIIDIAQMSYQLPKMNCYSQPCSLIILNNCSTHRSEALREIVEAAGEVIYYIHNFVLTNFASRMYSKIFATLFVRFYAYRGELQLWCVPSFKVMFDIITHSCLSQSISVSSLVTSAGKWLSQMGSS